MAPSNLADSDIYWVGNSSLHFDIQDDMLLKSESNDSEGSSIFVLRVSILLIHTIFLMDFWTIPTVWYFWFFILYIQWNLCNLTHQGTREMCRIVQDVRILRFYFS